MLIFEMKEGELLCNISRKQLDNSEDVEHLVQRQVILLLITVK